MFHYTLLITAIPTFIAIVFYLVRARHMEDYRRFLYKVCVTICIIGTPLFVPDSLKEHHSYHNFIAGFLLILPIADILMRDKRNIGTILVVFAHVLLIFGVLDIFRLTDLIIFATLMVTVFVYILTMLYTEVENRINPYLYRTNFGLLAFVLMSVLTTNDVVLTTAGLLYYLYQAFYLLATFHKDQKNILYSHGEIFYLIPYWIALFLFASAI